MPYRPTNKLRHNLDSVHIEKNMCDNFLRTLLDVLGKWKDHVNSFYDSIEMGILKELQPVEDVNHEKIQLDRACLKLGEKKLFCTILEHVKFWKECMSTI